MRLVSVNIGRPRLLIWRGETFNTGILKTPVEGRIMLRKTNLDGDRQADLSVHGGEHKAAYGYPSEHYGFWRSELSLNPLPWGAFGENFTTEGMLETDLCPGDEYRIGTAIVRVTTPRLPCLKLAAKFRRDDMIERFLRSGFSGFYFSVAEEGEVSAGDQITLLKQAGHGVTIADVNRLYVSRLPDADLLRRAAQVEALPESWRQRFQSKLAESAGARTI